MKGWQPKISIVTPSLDQGRFIEEAIISVLNQGYPNFEHIIIDGGSKDGTLDTLKKYPHLIWISEPDRGQSDALNKGFSMCSGEIIGWLNADDKYLPGCFQTVAAYLTNHPEVDIVYGDYRWVDESGQVIQLRRELDFDLFMLKYLHILYIPSTATFFRRKIIDGGNFLDVRYHYAMDYDFFLRLALKGYKFAHIEGFLSDFRWHAESKTGSAAHKQLMEQEKALMEHDDFLKKFKRAAIRKTVKSILTSLARGKRYLLKGVRGYYLSQWSQGTRVI